MKTQLQNRILNSFITKRVIILVAILNLSIASAQTFTVDGLIFNIIPSTTNVRVGINSGITGEVTIPSSVIYNSVTYPVTSIGQQAFEDCTGLTAVTIPNSVNAIEFKAFLRCTGISSILIPNSVTTIGNNAFYECSGLTTVTMGNSVASIGDGGFYGCVNLTVISIPNSVVTIGNSAFYACGNLTSLTIGDSVTSIGSSAFNYCNDLTSLTLPNSVTTIGNFAFGYCNGLASLTIPNSITTIGEYVFFGCTNLSTVNCALVTPLVINPNVFGNVNQASCALNVPVGTISLYEAAPVWQNFNPINGVLSTESFVSNNNIKIYPNPVINILNVETPFTGVLSLKLINDLGQVVLKQNQAGSSMSLDVSNLSKGLYFLNINSEEGNSQTIKFIKK